MEFLTATILSGIVWDGIKELGSLTGKYIKGKLTEWIVDDFTCDRIAKKINDIPEEYKKSHRFLEVAIEEDKELFEILKLIKPDCGYTQNNSQSYNKDNNFVNGYGNHTGNTINNYYNTIPQQSLVQNEKESKFGGKCISREELKSKLDELLEENNAVFILYGPTNKNKEDIFSEKPYIWREMCKEVIVPNNAKIVKLLDDNKELLNREEIGIFITFKIHAKGFEDNQIRDVRRAEYTQFPIEIYNILK